MKENVRIEDLNESNMDDLIYVCSSKRLEDLVHQQGMKLKREWLREMLNKWGHVAKIAYLNDKPAAQILFFPEEADVTKAFRREGVLVVQCVYNTATEAQKLGIATKLLQSVIQDAKQRKSCLGNRPCRFMLAKAFNTGEFLPLPEFYKKNGFATTPEESVLCLPIEGNYEPTMPAGQHEPLPEDRNQAVVFYGPACQFGYPFAKKIEGLVHEVALQLRVNLVNEWEQPEESIKRKNWWLTVNAKPIHTFFMNTEKFKEEVRQALG
jgi:GNAT superfamily N-acetyltransferase